MQQLQLITSPHCPCNNDFLTTVPLRGGPPLLAFSDFVCWGKTGHWLGGGCTGSSPEEGTGWVKSLGLTVQDMPVSAAGVSGRPQSRGDLLCPHVLLFP